MNKKFFVVMVVSSLVSFSTFAGVKVTAMDLKINGETGLVNVSLDGRSNELPDLQVNGKVIVLTISESEAFQLISKKVGGVHLSAKMENGKALVRAVLPYEVKTEDVDLAFNNKKIEIIFKRTRVAKEVTATAPAATTGDLKATEAAAAAANAVSKDVLNEDYLNGLMKENSVVEKEEAAVEVAAAQKEIKKDEITAVLAAPVRAEPAPAPVFVAKEGNQFSFAGYAVKFTVFLAMVLGLFYGVVQLLKKGVFNRGKLGFLNNTKMIEVLSTTYVGPKRSLMIVKAHKQVFLVASSESGLQFLSEMSDTSGLIKEGEKFVTGDNFDTNLGAAELSEAESGLRLKENIGESAPAEEVKGIAALTAKDIVKFSDELKKKAKKLKPIEFN
ncbi:MAG TPA: flagellar biosynthetic protein FliO [Bacteriovoracaceae bacterium]|nr:flagellar biosynthetic protein FliO [Bacteriovoracaceae bacterium]